MIKKERIATPIVLIITVIIVPFILVLFGQKLPENMKNRPEQNVELVRSAFPVVEYSNEGISDPVRKAKSSKYGKRGVLIPDIPSNMEEVVHLDWEVGLSSLPTEKSQIVLIGTVTKATAFLSDNKGSVYSEFKVDIESVFKNDSIEEIQVGKSVYVERQGGVVRFPSGNEAWFFVAGQRMPRIKSRYLFFLSHDFPGIGVNLKDLHIITAYELKEDGVTPLDNPSGGTHPIAKQYRDKPISVLLNDLSASLNNR